jgi:threonine dehydratase
MSEAELAPLVCDIESALPRVHRFASPTPLLRLSDLDALVQGEVLLKAECFQATGSFKIRGALNAMTLLRTEQQADYAIAFSSGNHGIGVAYAGKCLHMRVTIVIPGDAPEAKINRIKALGAEIVFYDRQHEEREQVAEALMAERAAPLIKPYDDWHTIAGQGTCGAEIVQQTEHPIDAAIICAGGGGLSAGIGTYLKSKSRQTFLYTAEPEGWDDHRLSLEKGCRLPAPATGSDWCDGLLAPTPGELTFAINQANGAEGLCASEAGIFRAMRLAWYRLGLQLEPSGAVALACLLANPERFRGQRVLVTLTGGNVDEQRFQTALDLAG